MLCYAVLCYATLESTLTLISALSLLCCTPCICSPAPGADQTVALQESGVQDCGSPHLLQIVHPSKGSAYRFIHFIAAPHMIHDALPLVRYCCTYSTVSDCQC
jgi:hypothetical protein